MPFLNCAVIHSRSTVFVRWHQCIHPSDTQFCGSTPLTIPNRISIGLSVFAWSMLNSSSFAILHFTKICPFLWGSSSLWFLGHTWPTTPNSILIKSAIFPEYTFVISRQTWQNEDGTWLVRTGCLCYRTVQPNKFKKLQNVMKACSHDCQTGKWQY